MRRGHRGFRLPGWRRNAGPCGRDSSEACGAVDEEEAQRLDASDSVAIGALARARFRSSQSRMQLKASHQVMREDGELEPGAVGPVVIGGHHVEGKFGFCRKVFA